MRTTLDLDAELLTAARKRARDLGTTLTAIVEEALAAALAHRPTRREGFRLRWKPHRGRLLAGIDIANRDALYEAMERRR